MTYPRIIQNRLDQIDKERARIASLSDVAADIEAFAPNIFTCFYSQLTVFPDDVSGFLRHLKARGYVLRGEPSKDHYSETGIIQWRFSRRGESEVVIVVTKTVGKQPKPGETCRMVITGKKIIEQPIYELICDPEPEEVPA